MDGCLKLILLVPCPLAAPSEPLLHGFNYIFMQLHLLSLIWGSINSLLRKHHCTGISNNTEQVVRTPIFRLAPLRLSLVFHCGWSISIYRWRNWWRTSEGCGNFPRSQTSPQPYWFQRLLGGTGIGWLPKPALGTSLDILHLIPFLFWHSLASSLRYFWSSHLIAFSCEKLMGW